MKTPIVIIVALLVIGGVYMVATRSDEAGTDTATSTVSAEGPNSVFVVEQLPGDEVLVERVNTLGPAFVVIRDAEGEIAGVSDLLPAGQSQKVSVALDQAMADGEEYVAVLYADDGDRTFDAASDQPVSAAQGGTNQIRFMVDADAPDPADFETKG